MSENNPVKTDTNQSNENDDKVSIDAENVGNNITQALHRSKSFPKTIDVSVKGLEITLTGAVLSSSDKITAEATAKSEPGASHVQNDLNIP
jgi:osmotically-inducible protein OsmY